MFEECAPRLPRGAAPPSTAAGAQMFGDPATSVAPRRGRGRRPHRDIASQRAPASRPPTLQTPVRYPRDAGAVPKCYVTQHSRSAGLRLRFSAVSARSASGQVRRAGSSSGPPLRRKLAARRSSSRRPAAAATPVAETASRRHADEEAPCDAGQRDAGGFRPDDSQLSRAPQERFSPDQIVPPVVD